MILTNSTQDSYIGSTAASQAAEAGTTASILPSPDGRDAQHRSFGRSQKKMCSGTEPTQSAEYSRILPHHRAAIQTSYMQDSYIGSTAASQAAEAGSTPVSCSKKKCHPTGWHFFLEYGSRGDTQRIAAADVFPYPIPTPHGFPPRICRFSHPPLLAITRAVWYCSTITSPLIHITTGSRS